VLDRKRKKMEKGTREFWWGHVRKRGKTVTKVNIVCGSE